MFELIHPDTYSHEWLSTIAACSIIIYFIGYAIIFPSKWYSVAGLSAASCVVALTVVQINLYLNI